MPLTMGGLAPFQIANALAASLAAFAQGVDIEHIRQALLTFQASTSQTPGRMNLFNLGKYQTPWWITPTMPPATKPSAGFVKKLARSSHRRGRWPWRPSG